MQVIGSDIYLVTNKNDNSQYIAIICKNVPIYPNNQ